MEGKTWQRKKKGREKVSFWKYSNTANFKVFKEKSRS